MLARPYLSGGKDQVVLTEEVFLASENVGDVAEVGIGALSRGAAELAGELNLTDTGSKRRQVSPLGMRLAVLFFTLPLLSIVISTASTRHGRNIDGAALSPPIVGVAEALLDALPMPRVSVVKLKPETGNNNPSLSIAPLTVTVYAAPAPNSFAGVRNASMPASAATTLIFSIPLGPLKVTVSGFKESTRNGFENRKTSIGSSATWSGCSKANWPRDTAWAAEPWNVALRH